MTASPPCSDTAPLAVPRDGLIVLEGMPGAGKTTAACALAARGLPVLGEYTDNADATIAIARTRRSMMTTRTSRTGSARPPSAPHASLAAARSTPTGTGSAHCPTPTPPRQPMAAPCSGTAPPGPPAASATAACSCPGSTSSSTSTPPPAWTGAPAGSGPATRGTTPARCGGSATSTPAPAGRWNPVDPGLAQALRQPRRADISGLSDPHQIAGRLAELGGQP